MGGCRQKMTFERMDRGKDTQGERMIKEAER